MQRLTLLHPNPRCGRYDSADAGYIVICSKHHALLKNPVTRQGSKPQKHPPAPFSNQDPPPPIFFQLATPNPAFRVTPRQWYLVLFLPLLCYTQHPCIDCGETNPIILEFDHVTGDKQFNISNVAREGYGMKRLKDEIAKCEVRCANCHRKKTYERSGWTHKD